MSDVFIAHVEENAVTALEIALSLEEAGYATWCYELDSIPGPSYLIQTGRAVEQAKAIVVVISPDSVGSRQVTKEVVRAHESGKEFIPVLQDISHVEFQNRQPEWREAIGASASIRISQEGVASILPRIISGLEALDIRPMARPKSGRITHIRKILAELQGHSTPERAAEAPQPARKPEPGPVTVKTPSAKTAQEVGRPKKWSKPAIIVSSLIAVIALGVVGVGMLLSRSGDVPPKPPSPSPVAATPVPPTPKATPMPLASPAPPLSPIVRQPDTLFSDDFESGTLESWRIPFMGGVAKIGNKDGNRFLDSTNSVVCVAGSNSWTDYSVKARVLLVEGTARSMGFIVEG